MFGFSRDKIAVCLAVCIISSLPAHLHGQSDAFSGSFTPYSSCNIPGGPGVVETSPLSTGISERTVKTMHGPAQIAMSAGRRIMFAYPGEDFYANVKVEILPLATYKTSRASLIDEFDYILASGDNSRNYNYALKSTLNGFDVRGLDREKREGGVLGIYLLFDENTRVVTTIYFLNQEPPRRFHTMAEYADLRDRFLTSYTACVRSKL
jgi:hypothetical protein